MPSTSASSVERATPYAAGDLIAGKYQLEALLGEGGMGAVWRAAHLQLETSVAIKLIRSELDRELLTARLKQEARAAAKLGHPAIVRVFDVGESERGDPFIVMELLTGQTLAELLTLEPRLSAARAVQLLLPIADALCAAHEKNIVHRDLKPDNVFITLENAQVQPKLLDFGIAKLTGANRPDTHLTQAGMVLGSPDYMSPEQARGLEDLDHRTDIWSFCVMLYETLAGVAPFSAASYNALLRKIVEDEPQSLVELWAADQRLWDIVQRGLAKDVEQRFATMADLGRVLAAWLMSQGIFEDVSGASLDSRWIARTSEPLAERWSRPSLASFGSSPPDSGVRAARGGALAGAATLALAPDRVRTTGKVRRRWRNALMVALGALALLGALVAVFARSHTFAQPLGQESATRPAVPRAAPSTLVQPALTPPPLVSVTTENVPVPASASAARALSKPAPKPHRAARPLRPALPTEPPSVAPDSATRDLISPYQ